MSPRNSTPRALKFAAALLALTVATGCEVSVTEGADPSAESTGGSGSSSDSQALLDELTVAKAGSMSGYSREKFPHWSSTGGGCDTRDAVLEREGTNVKLSGCEPKAGTWTSLYDGDKITDPGDADIDHMVPLANAWRSGADKWETEERKAFANDMDRPQLLAVSASSNRSKGDQDPSTWKPELESSWCQYSQDWITVKSHYKLSVTTAEKSALEDMLATC